MAAAGLGCAIWSGTYTRTLRRRYRSRSGCRRPSVPAAAALWRSAERQAERSFDLLLAEFAYQQRFRRRHPVIPNTVPVPTETVPPGRDRVVYLGTVTEARGCQLMIAVGRALAALPKPGPPRDHR